jgi:cytochrome c oxidase assembly protein subunit 15
MNIYNMPDKKDLFVTIWLFFLTFMIFLMIAIGGLTRLTESGLSMVDWKPLMGVIPPLNYEDWIIAFNKYKMSPEFQIINKSMDINEFKYIYWWEWFHRFFARCIGIVFIIPLFVFLIQKKVSKKLTINLFVLFLFGLFQALVGWWMVKSGLTENPYVSPYRLAFHLTNAVIILAILQWIGLNSLSSNNIKFLPTNRFENFQFFLIFLLFLTIISGAFMAGTHAGQSFNTYPLMGGQFIPDDYILYDASLRNFFENTVAINFNHRWLASFTFVLITIFTIYLSINKKYSKHRLEIILIFAFACLQFFLGILTLLTNVNIILASMHQINSMLLLSSLLFFFHQFKKQKKL